MPCAKQSLLSQNSSATSQKVTRVCKCPSEKLRKVNHACLTYTEKKTIVFDIDETLVLATTNKSELKQIDD